MSSVLDLLRQETELLCLWCAVQSEALCSSLPCRCAGRCRRPQLEDCLKGHFPLVCVCIGAEVQLNPHVQLASCANDAPPQLRGQRFPALTFQIVLLFGR